MNPEWIIRIVIFAVIHWVLAALTIIDLAQKTKVIGRFKAIWAILILFIPVFGSFLYLLFHPQIFYANRDR